jgi:hypothetical protein
MHGHVCPRCNRSYEHQRFVYAQGWSPLERIVARALHRFYGACAPCIHKFMKRGGDFFNDEEIQKLEVRSVQQFYRSTSTGTF